LAANKERILTLLVIPDSAGVEVKRLRVPRKWVIASAVAVSLLFVFFIAVLVHDIYLVGELKDIRQLRTENVQLRTQIERIDERVAGMTTVVDRVQQFDAQLRKITMLSDPERNIAMGPVGDLRKNPTAQDPLAAASAGLKRDLVKNSNDRAVDLIRHRLDVLDAETRSTEQSVRNLQLYLEDQQALLAQTPSLLPARAGRHPSLASASTPIRACARCTPASTSLPTSAPPSSRPATARSSGPRLRRPTATS